MKKNVLIIGAGISGEIIGREVNNNLKYNLIGYLDDDPYKKEVLLNEKPIFGNTSFVQEVIVKNNIHLVIISIPSAEGKTIKEILKKLMSTDVQVQIVPGYFNILEQDIKIDYPIRDIDVSDILGRRQTKLDITSISSYISSKRILITGAGGSIGRELVKLVASVNPNYIILLGRGENSIFQTEKEVNHLYPTVKVIPSIVNICNYSSLEDVFRKYEPQVVFHAAAHKHVNLMESHVKEAFRNNVLGSKNLMQLSHKYNVEKFVLISTDKAVQPSSVMGLTKRISELLMSYYAKLSKTIFCAVRFGNVLGSRGSVLPLFKEQIMRGGPVTITHKDVVRYFMTIPEASQLVIQAGALAQGREIFILNMGEPVKIYELAKLLIHIYRPNIGKDIQINFIGLRPGEKLVEKLWTPSEEVKTSKHKDIFVVYPELVGSDFLSLIEYCKNNLENLSEPNINKLLFEMIKSPSSEAILI